MTYLAAPALFPLTVFKQIELSIAHGNAPASAFGYSTYGMILCGVLGELDLGYKYGQLALKLLSEFDTREFKAAVLMVIYRFINHWKTHLKESLEPLQEGFQVGLETGDLSYGGYCSHGYCLHFYLTGRELSETQGELERYNEMLEAIAQSNSL